MYAIWTLWAVVASTTAALKNEHFNISCVDGGGPVGSKIGAECEIQAANHTGVISVFCNLTETGKVAGMLTPTQNISTGNGGNAV